MREFIRGKLLYEGKAKKIFSVQGHGGLIWQEFKDVFTAFNGTKKALFKGKGFLNCQISSFLFKKLAEKGVSSHWVWGVGPGVMVTQRLEMIDLEVVVRNVLAGSTAQKFQLPQGESLKEPLVEFYYKKDSLGDPFVSDEQAWMLGVVERKEDLKTLKKQAFRVNEILKGFFDSLGIVLVDFKLEFGYQEGSSGILLGDEISPDNCRLWDKDTGERLDKDRFRMDLGEVLEKYKEVLGRISKVMGGGENEVCRPSSN